MVRRWLGEAVAGVLESEGGPGSVRRFDATVVALAALPMTVGRLKQSGIGKTCNKVRDHDRWTGCSSGPARRFQQPHADHLGPQNPIGSTIPPLPSFVLPFCSLLLPLSCRLPSYRCRSWIPFGHAAAKEAREDRAKRRREAQGAGRDLEGSSGRCGGGRATPRPEL